MWSIIGFEDMQRSSARRESTEVDTGKKSNVTENKTSTFQMRINPAVKLEVEKIYAEQGFTLTDAVNMLIQQSLNIGGLPFLVSAENREYIKKKAIAKLIDEIEAGWDSVREEGWVSEEDAYRLLGVSD